MPHSEIVRILEGLEPTELDSVAALASAFRLPHTFLRDPASNLVNETVLHAFGDTLRIHHAMFSRQPFSKDRFEYGLEIALLRARRQVVRAPRNNPGYDLAIDGVPVSLKTEAANNIRESFLHVSKWMELGRGEWELGRLLQQFLQHLTKYERILQLRCLTPRVPADGPHEYVYELVEIPKQLMLEGRNARLSIREDSRQNPKPGYGYVLDENGNTQFNLYFDGGTERKLQVKDIRKSLCVHHATWRFSSVPAIYVVR